MKRLLMDTCRPLIHNCTIEILFLFPAFIAGLFPRAIFTVEWGFYMRTYVSKTDNAFTSISAPWLLIIWPLYQPAGFIKASHSPKVSGNYRLRQWCEERLIQFIGTIDNFYRWKKSVPEICGQYLYFIVWLILSLRNFNELKLTDATDFLLNVFYWASYVVLYWCP